MLKNKCTFIIPYFGKFPNYFNLFLKSCENNSEFKWLIFTDDLNQYNYPSNVQVHYMRFNDLKELINSKFDFDVSLERPYKLCDFKPAYGYIFEEYLTDTDFWGHCDIDLVFGKLSDFISDELLNKYDKLFCLGHLVLYRNTYNNNRVFMLPVNGRSWYKESFQTDRITVFDETYGNDENINVIFQINNLPILEADYSANFVTDKSDFILVTYNPETKTFIKDYEYSLFCLEDGIIWGYKEIPVFHKKEFMYIHLQERKMKYCNNVLEAERIKIVPNRFLKLEQLVDAKSIKKIRKKYFNVHLLQFHYKWKKRKILKVINKVLK